MFKFNHAGNLGDLLYSLYFCKELSNVYNFNQFDFHIQVNVLDGDQIINQNHPTGNVRLSENIVNWLLPLLKSQKYFHNITFTPIIPDDITLNLDNFRKININFYSGNIISWYYNLCPKHLPREFWKPILTDIIPDNKFKDKILFSYTNRYDNMFVDINCLKDYKDQLIFLGVQKEYDDFCKKYFELPYEKTENALITAQYIAGAKGFIGKPSGLYTIAECMKVPRILIAPEFTAMPDGRPFPGPHNVQPIGGWCEDACTQDKLIFSIKELIKYV